MNLPLRLFGHITKKQIVFNLNLNTDKFKFKSVELINENKNIDFKNLFSKKDKTLFTEILSLYNGDINYLTYKENSWYNIKIPFYQELIDSLLVFDISNISQKFSEKVNELDYMEYIVDDAYYYISQKKIDLFGKKMILYWKTIKDQYPYASNAKVDKICSDALLNGCFGISVNDHFMIVLCEKNNKNNIIKIMNKNNISNIEWSI